MVTLKERIALFKKDLHSGDISSEKIFQKYLIDGKTYFFHEFISKPLMEITLKTTIAKALSIRVEDVIVVGSGKLGFSLNPQNLFKEFDSLFSVNGRPAREYRGKLVSELIEKSLK
jgi:hypothetical protein